MSRTQKTDGTSRRFAQIENIKRQSLIYPDKVRLNKYYYHHYSFWKDLSMIFATVLGRKVEFGGERI